ncbi:hypothetical protein Daus18300_002710 [Diaporthe australafricana]|uniref:Uncharacterized protein n=1 Tax=Diaporthe australafricana TaxID=127596 RepID=A0ABR3XKH9_9PEZI
MQGNVFNARSSQYRTADYRADIDQRKVLVDQMRNGLVTQDRYDRITGWLVSEMLLAFEPYFSDAYRPVDNAQNIELLIRDTRSIILKARELDLAMRSANNVYSLILGSEGQVCQIPRVPPPALQNYEVAGNAPGKTTWFYDQSTIGLIVVPGLIKFIGGTQEYPYKAMIRRARAFDQSDLVAA